ncbi:MAG: mechanosensitive ion channel [Tepidisphaera sp.]
MMLFLLALAAPPTTASNPAASPAVSAPAGAPGAGAGAAAAKMSGVEAAVAAPLTTLSALGDEVLRFARDKGPAVVGAMVIFVLAWMLSKWARRVVFMAFTQAKVDPLLAKFFGNMARWAVLAFAIVTCLGTLGFETTSLAAVIGAMGLAIGLALQGNLGNLASGVLLLIFRPFKIGDSVIVAGQAGIIDGIDLFTTNLDTADNRRIIVPNGAIFGGTIENQSHHPRRNITVPVATAGSLDLDRSRGILLDVAKRCVAETPGALADPAPAVALAEITPNVVWNVTVAAETVRHGPVRAALLELIKRTVDAEGLAPAPPVQLVRQVQ